MTVLGLWGLQWSKKVFVPLQWGVGGWGFRGAVTCQQGSVCISRKAQRGEILSGACLGCCFPHSAYSTARRGGVEGRLIVMCVYVSCQLGSCPVNLRCFDCHDIMCLNTVTPPLCLNIHTHTPFPLFFLLQRFRSLTTGLLFCERRIFGFSSLPTFF
ncbi:hypothetical protein AMECASPLE_009342 [Ameca splendens]|uniref:Secreted protein n=1 Tax=Ameca splendens TaxID=208324 RepID=A0ABV0Y043_9TELE